jgi:acyl-homoserine lactone acylase PvdQ
MAFGTALRTLGVAAFLGLNAKEVQADKPLTLDSNDVQIARSVTIYRDTYGVPHVFGPTDASCVFG